MSSEWESVLIDRIEKTTNLLEKSEKLDLDHLKQKRNLSAHPTIHSMDLFNPDSHTVQALMFNMLQSILIKPPFFTKNVVGKLVNDLKDRGDSGVSISDQELESLIKNRYLKHMSKKKQEQVFMAFWKFVFIAKNEDTNKNRDVNSRALNVLYKECSIDIKETIRKNKNKFEVNKELIPYLIFFISKHEELFERLDETTQADIYSYVKEEKSLRIVSPFLSERV